VVTPTGEHREQIEVLGSGSLTRLHAFSIESVGLDAVSDSYFAYLLPGKKGYALFVLALEALGKGELPPLRPRYFARRDTCNTPDFVTDDSVILTGLCDSVTLIAADGRVRGQSKLAPPAFLAEASPSQDQSRFVVGAVEPTSRSSGGGLKASVRVYATDRLTLVSEVALPGHSEDHVPELHYALSPDGSLLAVMYGFDLSVYQVSPTAPAASVGTPSAPRTEGSPIAEGTQVMPAGAQQGAAIQVTADLQDLRQDAIRAWVQISNRGTTDLPFTPEKATLEILNPARKTLAVLAPDKLATSIKRGAADDVEDARTACGPEDHAFPELCANARATAFAVEQAAEATAADVKTSALRAQVLKPGEQVQGAIFFTYQKKRGESVLHLPIGDQVFEFRFPEKR